MRIALLAPLISPIAPPFLAGAQALVADLAAGLAARGHDVTLYAAPGSHAPGVRIRTVDVDPAQLRPAVFPTDDAPSPLPGDADPAALFAAPDPEVFAAGYAFLRAYRLIAAHAAEHDLLHAHAYDWPAYAHATLQPLPVAHTLHSPAGDPRILSILGTLAPTGTRGGPVRLVTVSHACAATYAPYCRIDAVIYNGVPIARIPFGGHPAPGDYLLYAGRITPEKGVEDALEIARLSGKRLLLAGGVYDQAYFDTRIRPRLASAGQRAEYLGPLARERLWELMAGARAVLCPVHWTEPFGLVPCEAQAAGAPVIGYARGGLREVVADGVSGFLVPPGDIPAAVAAVARVPALARAACRAYVAQRFSLDAMLDAHEAFYASLLV
ncbi:MAG TPA: glycosyltransferase [Ktedonobacterales bacterium]|jgi:UDP-glucose:tetrahydrobiopterin glucosyltransferase|nr:glycosyltransferase [Ktedonobacterales bacterium]